MAFTTPKRLQMGASGAGSANYIEDVFSTWLYSSTGTSPSAIVNGIDLAGKGGLVIGKVRNYVDGMGWVDTVRGGSNYLQSDVTNEQFNTSAYSFNNNGYSLQSTNFLNFGTAGEYTFCSWTFRKQPKFFDVQTWTGDGVVRNIPHNLGSVPGCIIVKRTDSARDWAVYHRRLANTQYLVLNSTAAAATGANRWDSTTPTSTVFTVGANADVNTSGGTYVAYIFAHNAGGFGLTETDNVISCGSFTGTSKVTLGYEPQWLLIKKSSFTSNWYLMDTMRGLPATGSSVDLSANTSDAEQTNGVAIIDATGFTPDFGGDTSIYIAIRRGPMKVPTVGTSVYNAIARTGTGATANVAGVGFSVDLNWSHIRNQAYPNVMVDRLRGSSQTLIPSNTDGEQVNSSVTSFASMDGVQYGTSDRVNTSPNTYINWYFRRAPSFFDEVCYTGTSSARTITHNLGVAPELMILKTRSASGDWPVYNSVSGATQAMYLNSTTASFAPGSTFWNDTTPTSTVFSVGSSVYTNQTGYTMVAYLFATLAGVSKVGSYTGTGALLTVNCGFTSGARFVLIKRTDSTGGWYMYDSVRGITSGDDPYLFANLDAVEVTNTNYVDTTAVGFQVTAGAPAGLNANGGTYIFLAIA